MPYVVMTARAGQPASRAVGVRGIDREGQLTVTFAARLLGNIMVARGDPQRIRVASGREVERMPESVLRFGPVLRDEPRWSVAVVADGNRSMARARPRVKVILHDVAV